MMHAAHELNGPTYAHAILNTSELIAALPPAQIDARDLIVGSQSQPYGRVICNHPGRIEKTAFGRFFCAA
jgi:hypothetical protein